MLLDATALQEYFRSRKKITPQARASGTCGPREEYNRSQIVINQQHSISGFAPAFLPVATQSWLRQIACFFGAAARHRLGGSRSCSRRRSWTTNRTRSSSARVSYAWLSTLEIASVAEREFLFTLLATLLQQFLHATYQLCIHETLRRADEHKSEQITKLNPRGQVSWLFWLAGRQ